MELWRFVTNSWKKGEELTASLQLHLIGSLIVQNNRTISMVNRDMTIQQAIASY